MRENQRTISFMWVNSRAMRSVWAVFRTVLALCLVLLFGACSENQARKSPATSYQKAPIRATATTVAMGTWKGSTLMGCLHVTAKGVLLKPSTSIMYKKCELEKRTATALRLLNNQTLSTCCEWDALYSTVIHSNTHTSMCNMICSLNSMHVTAKVSFPSSQSKMLWF